LTSPPFALRGDRPIESIEHDRLGRAPFARALAEQILEAPALDSYVVAIMGPWGSGKTSLINMVVEEAKLRSDPVVVRFNPWIFSGTERLVGFFFRELGAQFSELKNDRLANIAASLKKYAGLFGSVAQYVPAVGELLKKGSELAESAAGGFAEPPSIECQRDLIRKQLQSIDKKIIVLVDDIDRLRRDEIREVVQLVRLTGDFPNVIYVLAFDRRRVEAALAEDDETGRAYLEKIVQVAYDVPVALEADIAKMLVDELEAAATGIEHGHFDEMTWTNIFHDVVRPLFRSPRDVRRYVNALPPTLRVLGNEVALPDVLALEAIRIFLPEIFAELPALVDALTSRERGPHRDRSQDPRAKAVQKLVENAGENRKVVVAMVTRLFPHAVRFLGGTSYADGYDRQWYRTRRVAVDEVLRFYLERRLPEGVMSVSAVKSAYDLLGDRTALTELLDKLDPERLENLLGRLEVYEDEYPPEHIEAAIGAILDQLGSLREGRRHHFDFGADLTLDRVVLRLLRRQGDQGERQAIVARVLPTVRSLSAQRGLIRLIEGHKLAGEQAIAAWKAELCERLLSVSPATLAHERHLGWLLAEAADIGGETAERARSFIEHDALLVRLLSSAISVQSRRSLSDVASVQEKRLPWKDIERVFGSERIAARVREARGRLSREQLDPQGNEALDLAMRYADGWRPADRLGGAGEDDDADPDENGSAEPEPPRVGTSQTPSQVTDSEITPSEE
jgi:predicted KAP-like P-loop ATPase